MSLDLVRAVAHCAGYNQVFFAFAVKCIVKPYTQAMFLRQDLFQYLLSKKLRNCFAGMFVPVIFCPTGGQLKFDRAAFLAGDRCSFLFFHCFDCCGLENSFAKTKVNYWLFQRASKSG